MKINEHSNSVTIYLQQMQNYIDMGAGYNNLRKLLFKELYQLQSSQQSSQDNLADSIVTSLVKNLNYQLDFHQSEKIYRTVQIVEDMLTYAEDIMTTAMNNQLFISALIGVALPKLVTFNSKLDMENKTRVLGIFMFWFDKYGRDTDNRYELFFKSYTILKKQKLVFPAMSTIKPNDFFKKQAQKEQQKTKQNQLAGPNTNKIILQDISDFTIKTQTSQKQNIKQIATTEYVRLIKHKSKVLYEFTTKPNEFGQKQKTMIKDLYKRLRTVLKDIDKYNDSNVQTNKMKAEQIKYVQMKMTPKKDSSAKTDQVASEKKISNKKISEKKESETIKQNNDLLDIKQISKLQSKVQAIKIVKPTSDFDDLLEMAPAVRPPSPLQPDKKTNSSNAKLQSNCDYNIDLLTNDLVQKKVEEEQEQFVDGILIDTSPVKAEPKQTEAEALFSVFANPQTPNKKKEDDDQNIIFLKQASAKSNESDPSFQNQRKKKNPYSFIPDNLNLTPNSSNNEDEEDRIQQNVGFNFFGLLGNKNNTQNKDIYEHDKIHYDDIPKKKASTVSEGTPTKKQNKQQLKTQIEQQINTDKFKVVQPVDYSKYAMQRSPISHKSEEDEENKLQVHFNSPNTHEPQLELPTEHHSADKTKVHLEEIQE